MSKYKNRKVIFDGMRFDSKKELLRYNELQLMAKSGIISCLKRQVPFELVPKQLENGRVVERPVKYIADFAYYESGHYIVEDVKSPVTRTDAYKIKRKLMLYVHGVRIKEV